MVLARSIGHAAFVVALLLLGACGRSDKGDSPRVTPATDDTVSAARFEWFRYSGNDPAFEAAGDLSTGYLNPVLAGFYPDPSVTRAGDDYYLVTSTFGYFPGIPVMHSRDLVNWEQVGNVIDRSGMLDFDGLGLSRGVFAPTIEFHDGTFYVGNTCVDCGGNFIVTTKDPAGPWSDPIWLPEVGGIDPRSSSMRMERSMPSTMMPRPKRPDTKVTVRSGFARSIRKHSSPSPNPLS